jgi:ferrous iron transport protein A
MVETPLSDLEPGDVCAVSRVMGASSLRRRLLDMGIVKGTRLEVVRTAPLGDPVEIKVKDYSLTLRKREADYVLVTKE